MSDISRDYSFGGWLRYARVRREITLRKAAAALGIDPGNLSKLERSELNPPRSGAKIEEFSQKLGFDSVTTDILKSTAFSFHIGQFKKEFDQ